MRIWSANHARVSEESTKLSSIYCVNVSDFCVFLDILSWHQPGVEVIWYVSMTGLAFMSALIVRTEEN